MTIIPAEPGTYLLTTLKGLRDAKTKEEVEKTLDGLVEWKRHVIAWEIISTEDGIDEVSPVLLNGSYDVDHACVFFPDGRVTLGCVEFPDIESWRESVVLSCMEDINEQQTINELLNAVLK